MTKLWKDPAFRAKQSLAHRELWKDPAYRAKQSAAHVRLARDPGYRAMISEAVTRALADHEKRARHLAGRYRAAATLLKRESAETDRGVARRRGRPSMGKRNSSAVALRECGWSWRDVARKLDPNFAEDPDAAMDRVRSAVNRAVRSKNRRLSAMSRKLYTTIEVAKAADVPRATLQYWIKTGKISPPPVRLRRNKAVRLWTDAQKKRIRTLSGAFKSGPKSRRE